jgi:hypothetical protein
VAATSRRRERAVIDRSTVIRTAILVIACNLVALSGASIGGPALLEVFGEAGAQRVAAVGGLLAKVTAGFFAGRYAWRRGGGVASTTISVGVGAAGGHLAFPGWIQVLGLITDRATAGVFLAVPAATAATAVVCVAAAVVAAPKARLDRRQRPAKPAVDPAP